MGILGLMKVRLLGLLQDKMLMKIAMVFPRYFIFHILIFFFFEVLFIFLSLLSYGVGFMVLCRVGLVSYCLSRDWPVGVV